MINSIITSFKTLKREFFYFPLCVVGGFELSRLLHSGENFVTMEWKDIPGYEWIYAISGAWVIKSYSRLVNSHRKLMRKEMILKYRPNRWRWKYNSWRVILCKDGVRKQYSVSRLMWYVFLWLDLNNTDICVLHKDDNPMNNNLDNLFLGTFWDNVRDSLKKWRHYNCRKWYILI